MSGKTPSELLDTKACNLPADIVAVIAGDLVVMWPKGRTATIIVGKKTLEHVTGVLTFCQFF